MADVRQQPCFEWQVNQSYVKLHATLQRFNCNLGVSPGEKKKITATHPVYTLWLFLAPRNRLWSNSSAQKQGPSAPETGTNRLHTASGNDCLRPPADVRRKTGQVGLLLEWGDAEKRHYINVTVWTPPPLWLFNLVDHDEVQSNEAFHLKHKERAHILQTELECVTTCD